MQSEEKVAQKNGSIFMSSKEEDHLNDFCSHYNMYCLTSLIISHEDILKDKERIMPFINAIQRNKHLFEGKTVLEINCGTAILSILASKQGAKHVYAVSNLS
jgi:protein-disulfide isomerase-like protein with CxxC motif